jgi:hypothetical protein
MGELEPFEGIFGVGFLTVLWQEVGFSGMN